MSGDDRRAHSNDQCCARCTRSQRWIPHFDCLSGSSTRSPPLVRGRAGPATGFGRRRGCTRWRIRRGGIARCGRWPPRRPTRLRGHRAAATPSGGLQLEANYQRERRQLAARRKAAFAVEPTGPNQVWQLDFTDFEATIGRHLAAGRLPGLLGPSTNSAGASPQRRTNTTRSAAIELALAEAGRLAGRPLLELAPRGPDGTLLPLITILRTTVERSAPSGSRPSSPLTPSCATSVPASGRQGRTGHGTRLRVAEVPAAVPRGDRRRPRPRRHAERYRIDYNTIRPHEALSWNRPIEVHLARPTRPPSRARNPANCLTGDTTSATRWACQRSRVLGETSRSRRSLVGSRLLSALRNARSTQVSAGRGLRRRSTATSCRRPGFRRPWLRRTGRAAPASQATRATARYASRRATASDVVLPALPVRGLELVAETQARAYPLPLHHPGSGRGLQQFVAQVAARTPRLIIEQCSDLGAPADTVSAPAGFEPAACGLGMRWKSSTVASICGFKGHRCGSSCWRCKD